MSRHGPRFKSCLKTGPFTQKFFHDGPKQNFDSIQQEGTCKVTSKDSGIIVWKPKTSNKNNGLRSMSLTSSEG